jgi:hypothetical protein
MVSIKVYDDLENAQKIGEEINLKINQKDIKKY